MDNGPKFTSKRLENWAKEKQIELLHTQPDKPTQNVYIERFNRTFRENVLDAYLFDDLDEVRLITEHWIEDYNIIRPHEALQGLSPRQYAIQNAILALIRQVKFYNAARARRWFAANLSHAFSLLTTPSLLL
jgi:putative transposase